MAIPIASSSHRNCGQMVTHCCLLFVLHHTGRIASASSYFSGKINVKIVNSLALYKRSGKLQKLFAPNRYNEKKMGMYSLLYRNPPQSTTKHHNFVSILPEIFGYLHFPVKCRTTEGIYYLKTPEYFCCDFWQVGQFGNSSLLSTPLLPSSFFVRVCQDLQTVKRLGPYTCVMLCA